MCGATKVEITANCTNFALHALQRVCGWPASLGDCSVELSSSAHEHFIGGDVRSRRVITSVGVSILNPPYGQAIFAS